jgi:uncharacterized protein YfaS (alpha-2-macroglobulin family)
MGVRLAGACAGLIGLFPALCLGAAVEVFSPQGEVKGVRQVAVRFSEPMVSFGDPRLAEPFDIDCAEKGAGRWADQKNWVFDFERDLPAGMRCSFGVKQDLRTLAGEKVDAAQFVFTTGGPAIIEYLPYPWERIDEEQVFILGLDAPARDETVARHAWCDVSGLGEKLPVKLVAGEDRRKILEQRTDFVGRYLQALFKSGRVSTVAERELLRGTQAEQLRETDKLPLVLVHCGRPLPASAKIRLVWGQGIESASGVPTSQDQAIEFEVRPAFSARFSCQRVNRDAACLPFGRMTLAFSGPIPRTVGEKMLLRAGDGKVLRAKLPPAREGDHVHEVWFDGPFAEQASYKLEIPADVRDDAGRRLTNQKRFPLAVKTDAAPPLAKFPARFGIIELKAGATLPVTLRNVEPEVAGHMAKPVDGGKPVPGQVLRLNKSDAGEIVEWMRRVAQSERVEYEPGEDGRPGTATYGAAQSMFKDVAGARAIKVPKPGGARAFEVVGIPLRQPGFYTIELASPRLGEALLAGADPKAKSKPVYHVATTALVTNLAVHFKQGRESSLVWVTALDSGEPAAKAAVSIQDCSGREYWKGATDARGVARVSIELPARETLPGCLDEYDRQYMVFARAAGDMSFVMSGWNEGIASWRFNLPSGRWDGPYVASAILDRTLVRAGETVSMKLLYRQHARSGFRFVFNKDLGDKVTIQHQGSDDKFELPIRWDGRNSAELAWSVPKDAKIGVYRVLTNDTLDGNRRNRDAGMFRVEEFRVPLMRAAIEPPAKPLVNADSADVGLQVSHLAGGGAAYLPVKLRSVVQPKAVSFPGYEEFTLGNGAVKEGVQEDRRQDWYRGDYLMEDPDAEVPADAAAGPATRPLKTVALQLDGGGGAKAQIAGVPRSDTPQEIVAELEYADPNGETLTASTRIPLWPAQLVVGLKPDAWAVSKDKVKFQAVALDLAGQPVAGARLAVDLFERRTFSHRKRLLGGFYAYQSGAEVKRLATVCEAATDAKGLLFCEFASPVSGEVLVQVRARDAAGNPVSANASAWVAGGGEWWFDLSNDDRMDLLPERKRYEPGDKAVFQVRMPFRKATALVTVEREGVMETFVQQLSGQAPVVEVPVRGNYAPNVFVSVLAVRGRVADVQPTALVDLGKPAFRMGVAEINVGWRAHELKVAVKADKPVYRVRDQARVEIEVTRAIDGVPAKGGEVALAAVDEGLLELMPNASWKLLDNMMRRRGIEVESATASMQVVGKRHYGRKAREAGGGGGRKTSRELFDTLLLWKARVKLDDQGRAQVAVPLNDSVTSFRIVAVADAATDLFGTGQTSIRTTQELMLFSGLPPLVREQDSFRAAVTVRNASAEPLDADVSAALSVADAAGRRSPPQALAPVRLNLPPGVSQEASWEARVPLDAQTLHWEFVARAKPKEGPAVEDRLKVGQRAIPAVPVRTFQATIAQIDGSASLPVEIPADAIPGRGGVRVSLLPSLAGELAGVVEYMSRYPYTCLEQLVSQAVALRDEARWRGVMSMLPSYLDRDGFAKYFTLMQEGSDALTTYLLSIAAEAGWAIPDGPRGRMQNALQRFVRGEVMRYPEWRAADLSIRKIAALQALARWGRPATAEDLASVAIEPNLWPTSGVIDWFDLLARSPDLPERDARLGQAEQILRSRLNFQGTTMGFSTEREDYLWWLMISSDVNANRMLLSVLDRDAWREDMARLARGSLGRQQRGHWNTTVANAWGVLAMEKFAAAFEKEPVRGTTRGQLAKQARELDWGREPRGGALMFGWPQGADDLTLAHEGTGKPWSTVQSLAAIPLKQPLSTGYRIARSVAPVEQRNPGKWSRGDVARVRLDLEAQADMSWVVVNDPIPAGASILGSGLARDSQILTAGEKKQGWVWPAFEERKFDSFRAYYRFVPKGKWSLEYSVRLNNPGEFVLPTTRVEALYAPEMFGELPNAKVAVGP